MEVTKDEDIIPLTLAEPIWERVFTVSPLILVGTREPDGSYNLAPKHMAMPLGWENYFGFVCTPRHGTYHNVQRERAFTVSYPRLTQVFLTTMAASSRSEGGTKTSLKMLPTFAAERVDGIFVKDAYLFLECELDRVVDDFGEYSLIAGRIIAAYAAADSVHNAERDDNELLQESPLLAYLNWGRYARIDKSHPFPFLTDFKR